MERRDFLKGAVAVIVPLTASKDTIAQAMEASTPVPNTDQKFPAKCVVNVGNENWEPTAEELTAIKDMVETWNKDPERSVLVVCQGIQITFFNEANADHVRVLKRES